MSLCRYIYIYIYSHLGWSPFDASARKERNSWLKLAYQSVTRNEKYMGWNQFNTLVAGKKKRKKRKEKGTTAKQTIITHISAAVLKWHFGSAVCFVLLCEKCRSDTLFHCDSEQVMFGLQFRHQGTSNEVLFNSLWKQARQDSASSTASLIIIITLISQKKPTSHTTQLHFIQNNMLF